MCCSLVVKSFVIRPLLVGSLLVDHGPWSMSWLVSVLFVGYVICSSFVVGRPWTLVNVVGLLLVSVLFLACYVIRRS